MRTNKELTLENVYLRRVLVDILRHCRETRDLPKKVVLERIAQTADAALGVHGVRIEPPRT